MNASLAMEMTLGSVITKRPVLAAVAFGGLCAGTVLIAFGLRRYQRKARRLSRSLSVLVLSALGIAVAAAVIAARLMVTR